VHWQKEASKATEAEGLKAVQDATNVEGVVVALRGHTKSVKVQLEGLCRLALINPENK
jgi:hypothetical protein